MHVFEMNVSKLIILIFFISNAGEWRGIKHNCTKKNMLLIVVNKQPWDFVQTVKICVHIDMSTFSNSQSIKSLSKPSLSIYILLIHQKCISNILLWFWKNFIKLQFSYIPMFTFCILMLLSINKNRYLIYW